MKQYFSMVQDGKIAYVDIYGYITSFPLFEGDMSSHLLSKQISGLDVDEIHVHIASYGGEVSEGWAIYNALKQHPAKVVTVADGFVCSIASVIFMAGVERLMNALSALMIHQPLVSSTGGNAAALQKEAEELLLMGSISAKAYLERVNISEQELTKMLDAETWITPERAVDMGFATGMREEIPGTGISQDAKKAVFQRISVASAETLLKAGVITANQAVILDVQEDREAFRNWCVGEVLRQVKADVQKELDQSQAQEKENPLLKLFSAFCAEGAKK